VSRLALGGELAGVDRGANRDARGCSRLIDRTAVESGLQLATAWSSSMSSSEERRPPSRERKLTRPAAAWA
jgi:hypothetical protein